MGFSGGSSGVSTPSVNVFQVLDNHIAAIAENTYTFTPAVPLTMAQYSVFIVEIVGRTTLALALQAQINGTAVQNYSYGLRKTQTPLVTAISTAINAANLSLLTAGILIAGAEFSGQLRIIIPENGSNIIGSSEFQESINIFGCESLQHVVNVASTTLVSININTSASTWQAGTRITIYGVKRAP